MSSQHAHSRLSLQCGQDPQIRIRYKAWRATKDFLLRKMYRVPPFSFLDYPAIAVRAAKAILTRLTTVYSPISLLSWFILFLGNHNDETVLDSSVVVIGLNVTNPSVTGVVYSPPLSNSTWQVRPFGSPQIEVATSFPGPSMSFQFQGEEYYTHQLRHR